MRVLKVLMGIVALVVLLVLAGGTYVKFALPDVGPPPEITIKPSEQRLKRGEYLANYVTVCMDCHGTRDWGLYAGPMKKTGIGAGGEIFDQKMGFPGTFRAPNITPGVLKGWTDGEIFRAITTGVSKDGRALFPLMAAHRFGKMDKEDINAIITYIRSLPADNKVIPISEPDFPVNFLINTMPKKAAFTTLPKETDVIQYGGYLVNAAGCVDCHSKMDKGNIIAGTEFGGGMEFKFPQGIVRSPNITNDEQTGIGSWTKDYFVQRFQLYIAPGYQSPKVETGINTPMPWTMYGRMKKNDLEAIYAYLRTVKTQKNQVVIFEPGK